MARCTHFDQARMNFPKKKENGMKKILILTLASLSLIAQVVAYALHAFFEPSH
jgi:hypothetical protein